MEDFWEGDVQDQGNALRQGFGEPNLYPGGYLLERIVVLICTGGIYKSRNPIHLMDPSCYNLSSVIDL